MMSEAAFFDIVRQGLWVSVKMSTPLLATALVAGVAVGLVQALTSIQEMTLTFVPKLAALVAVFWVSMGYMTGTLAAYFQGEIVPLISAR